MNNNVKGQDQNRAEVESDEIIEMVKHFYILGLIKNNIFFKVFLFLL